MQADREDRWHVGPAGFWGFSLLEVVFRTARWIEFHYCDKIRESEAGRGSASEISYEEGAAFSGATSSVGNYMVSPALLTHAKLGIEQGANLAKDLRKAAKRVGPSASRTNTRPERRRRWGVPLPLSLLVPQGLSPASSAAGHPRC